MASPLDQALHNGTLSRRELGRLLGGGAAAGLLGGALPGPAARAMPVEAGERKLLFLFVKGGWDPTYTFVNMLDSPYVAVDEMSEPVMYGELEIMVAAERPSVDAFFTAYADRCCVLQGMEVRAVTHEQCRRLLMTGTSDSAADDWPSTIAGSSDEYLLPSLVVSGPAFTTNHVSSVIRLGRTAQLGALLDGTALTEGSDLEVALPASGRAARIEAYVADRVDQAAEVAAARLHPSSQGLRYARDHQASIDRLGLVRELEDELNLSVDLEANAYTEVKALVEPALTCLELGLSRVAVVEHAGYLSKNWDSHAQIGMQSVHYEVLFSDLLHILEELDTRRGPAGGRLSDEVTVVVMSEMGRAPIINAAGGKDHWTYTSVLFIGPGVQGGRSIGGYDESLLGLPMDLASGEPDPASGARVTSQHLGATLMALADLDPGEVPVIEGLLA